MGSQNPKLSTLSTDLGYGTKSVPAQAGESKLWMTDFLICKHLQSKCLMLHN